MESTLSRRERERERRRQSMLEAARAVFAEKGYRNATIEEVAHRAEFGKGTVYNYFEGGKEELLFAILDELHDDLCSLIESEFSPEATAGRSFRDVFLHFIETLFNNFLERRDVFALLMKEAQQMIFSDDDEKAAYFVRQSNRVVGALVGPLQKAIDEGHIKPLPAAAIAHTILGNVKGMLLHRCVASRNPDCTSAELLTAQKAAEFLNTMLLDGLLVKPEPQPC